MLTISIGRWTKYARRQANAMKVIDVKHVEDCFDGSLIYELLLDADIDKDLIFAIGEGGYVQYFDKFAKPFFKIRMTGQYDLKGIAGERNLRIHLKSLEVFTLEDFIALIESLVAATLD
jgi:hypothetical protein